MNTNQDQFKRYLVSCALPYANGPIHIGHLAGVYIPADIYVRYLRLRGRDVKFICGSDEHGVPITIKAKNEGISPQEVVDKYHSLIKSSFKEFGIEFDIYARTSDPIHHDTASEFFRTLYSKNKFIEKETEQLFDPKASQFLADRYVTGTCPHCKSDGAYGDQCEKCGTSLNATDLINPKSAISGAKPILRATKHWYLPLDEYTDFLNEWILEGHKDWKTNVYGQCKSWIKDIGLMPRAVTRDLNWGVPVPVSGADGKVLYVWFDAPIGYISATKELTSDWELYWKDKETRLIHFIGKDNIVFHCIIFPAMLKAEGSYILPDNVPANEFLNLEGDKISTSRNWAVWLHEYLKEFPEKQDVLRYVLTANAPETKDNDFTWSDFQSRNNNELLADLGNFVNRTLVLTQKYFQGIVPEPQGFESIDLDTLNEILKIKMQLQNQIEHFHFREALKELINLARLGNRYFAHTEPWKVQKTDTERVQTVMYIALQITANLAAMSEPFLPFTSKKLHQFLNLPAVLWDIIGVDFLLSPGHKLGEFHLLFERVENEVVEFQVQKLLKTKTANMKQTYTIPEQKSAVSFEEFAKMDIRLATVLEAVKVPKTKKLLQLKIDTGVDIRTIVSGIAEFYEPEHIIGKQIQVLVNLEPRTIRGIESQGMILMVQNPEGTLSMMNSDKPSTAGSPIA